MQKYTYISKKITIQLTMFSIRGLTVVRYNHVCVIDGDMYTLLEDHTHLEDGF